MDLPIGDVDATLDDYAGAVIDAISALDDPVLVGHSMGGLVIPLVAARRRVSRLVFLCAMFGTLPDSMNAFSASAVAENDIPMTIMDMSEIKLEGGLLHVTSDCARRSFFHDCSPSDQQWALERLRPQAHAAPTGAWPLAHWPDVPCSVIACTEDRAHNPDYSRRVASPRLGVHAIVLPGSHSPFLSRPSLLADTLVHLT